MTKAVELELQLYILFSEEKIETALDLIEKVPNWSYFVHKDKMSVGIKLSNEKKGAIALTIYKKIHTHVVKELKYKVSLNAAITAYKMTKFELAIKYANLCDKELGEKNDKAEKNKAGLFKILKAAKGWIMDQNFSQLNSSIPSQIVFVCKKPMKALAITQMLEKIGHKVKVLRIHDAIKEIRFFIAEIGYQRI